MLVILIIISGAIFGSFCNVVIYRPPLILRGETRLHSRPPSHCPRCQQAIRRAPDSPLVGWLLPRARRAYSRPHIIPCSLLV